MRLTVLFAVLLVLVTAIDKNAFQLFRDANENTVDYSSLATCFALGGKKIDMVSANNVEKGFKCTITIGGWTKDQKQAHQLCQSRLPYYIIDAKSGALTTCTFQVNKACGVEYWQINGKCYRVTPTKHTWAEAPNVCKSYDSGDLKVTVAEYYSTNLRHYFHDIQALYEAWVYVSDFKDFYANGRDGHAAVYVQEGAYKYDTKEGSILMEDESSKHQVLCEYTAPMTMGEMYYIAEIYSEVYPISVYDNGAILPSSNFMTIQQTQYIKDTEHFSTTDFDPKCMAIGGILNVQSYPVTSMEEEFNDVKDLLIPHRFYLTNAYKNDGCKRTGYRQQNEDKTSFQVFKDDGNGPSICNAHSFSFHRLARQPSMAAMRAPILCALHTFNWMFDVCPKGPSWSEPPLRYNRPDGRAFCHYINNRQPVTRDVAVRMCMENGLGASLTGVDEGNEFTEITHKLDPVYNTDSGSFIINGKKESIDHHYWVGARSKCATDCVSSTGELYVAGWENGVGVDTGFLNSYNHAGGSNAWANEAYDQFVTFRKDSDAFHLHTPPDPYIYMFFVCGKTAPLVRSERKRAKLVNKG